MVIEVVFVAGAGAVAASLTSPASFLDVLTSWDAAGVVRTRSPRMQTEGSMTTRPPRIMCCVPWSWARRATLLPVSVSM